MNFPHLTDSDIEPLVWGIFPHLAKYLQPTQNKGISRLSSFPTHNPLFTGGTSFSFDFKQITGDSVCGPGRRVLAQGPRSGPVANTMHVMALPCEQGL